MSWTSLARCGALAIGLAATVTFGATGCGQSTPQAGSATTTAPAPTTDAPTATGTPSATEDAAPAAGAEATQATPVPVDPGDGVVDGPAVAQSVTTELTKIVGRAPDSVTCPDLAAKVGTQIRCTLVDGSDTYGVAVTTTSVQGTDVKFGIKVDDQPS